MTDPRVPVGVTETPGSGSLTDTHAYAVPGPYVVTVTVNDKDGGVVTRSVVVTVNAPPSVDSGGPYAGTEGSTLTLGGSATDPNGDPLTKSWTFSVAGGPGTSCTTTGTTTLHPDDHVQRQRDRHGDPHRLRRDQRGGQRRHHRLGRQRLADRGPGDHHGLARRRRRSGDRSMTFTDAGTNDTHTALDRLG